MARSAVVRLVEDERAITAPGDCSFIVVEGIRVGITHACPCGCGGKSALFFRGKGGGRAEWDVSGEWPHVTLSPSIGIKYDGNARRPLNGAYHWHGYLRAGVFVEE